MTVSEADWPGSSAEVNVTPSSSSLPSMVSSPVAVAVLKRVALGVDAGSKVEPRDSRHDVHRLMPTGWDTSESGASP